MLSHQDKLILYALSTNCRFSISTIADISGLHKETVKKRIKKMEEEEIIDKYYMTVYKIHVGIVKYTDTFYSGRFSQEQIDKIKDISETITITTFYGKWNLRVSLNAEGIDKKNDVIKGIKDILSPNLTDFAEYELGDSKYLRRLFFIDKDPYELDNINPKGSFHSLLVKHRWTFPSGLGNWDEIDMKIMEELRLNANMSLVEISKRTGADRKTVEKRIKKFISTGTVGYFVTNLNYEKMGYNQFVLFLDTKDKEKVISIIRMNRHAHSYFEYNGKMNLCFTFFYENHEDMKKYIDELYKHLDGNLQNHLLLEATGETKFISFPEELGDMYKKAKILFGREKVIPLPSPQ